MEIVFLGTSCMVPTKERNHQGILITYRNEGILIDCGEGTQRQLKIANIKPTKITKILITHWHGDHVLGLPGLLQTLNSSEYEKKLEIFGPKGTLQQFEHMFKAFKFTIGFPYSIKEIGQDVLNYPDVVIESKEMRHSLPCNGYSVKEKDTRRIKVKEVKKIGIPEGPLLGKLQEDQDIEWKGKIYSPKDLTYVVKGKKTTIILDTLPCKNAYDLAKESNLLICEASYESSLQEKSEEYLHMTAAQAALLATESGSEKLVLTHFSQRYKTVEPIMEEAKTVFENVLAAHDFMKLKI